MKLREYLKIAEAAEFLGISQNTLRKWADEGRIAVRVNPANGYRMFRRQDLERFLKDAAKPTSPKKSKLCVPGSPIGEGRRSCTTR